MNNHDKPMPFFADAKPVTVEIDHDTIKRLVELLQFTVGHDLLEEGAMAKTDDMDDDGFWLVNDAEQHTKEAWHLIDVLNKARLPCLVEDALGILTYRMGLSKSVLTDVLFAAYETLYLEK